MSASIRWGILSTGRIAGVFARGLAGSCTGKLVAVASRTQTSADTFAAAHGGVRAHGSYEALLADPEVDAVYIATPHPQHAEWAIKAAEAGKHLLCEKPLTVSLAGARRVVAAARRARVVLMEAFMYRCHPQTRRVVELIRAGELGRVLHVEASFGFNSEFSATSRLWNRELGGGGILDVGGYPISWARLIAGANDRLPFLDPVAVLGAGTLHPQTGVDVHAVATLAFPGGMTAHVSCAVGLTQENVVRIHGTRGWLLVPSPYVISRDGSPTKLILHRAGASQPEEITVTAGKDLYAYEADAFGEALQAGAGEVAAMTPDDTLGNMAVLDAWLRQVGVVYPDAAN